MSLYVNDREKFPVVIQWDRNGPASRSKILNRSHSLCCDFISREQLMNHPVGYTPQEPAYWEWLQCGLQVYKNEKQVAKR